jgi:hypothetical protein
MIERLLEEGFTSTDIASACLAQLQSGEAAAKPQRTEDYERPERDERPQRGGFHDSPRPRYDDRGPRFERRERVERPRRFEDRPSRSAAAIPVVPRPSRSLAAAPVARQSPPAKPKPTVASAAIPVASAVSVEAPQPEVKPAAEIRSDPETKPTLGKTYSDEEVLASVKTPEATREKRLAPNQRHLGRVNDV